MSKLLKDNDEFKEDYQFQNNNNNNNNDQNKVLQELNNTLNKPKLNSTINFGEGKKIIAVLGKTGAGKSSFINKVIGNKIEYDESENILSNECKMKIKGEGPKIGGGIVSETTIPTVWQYSKNLSNILIGDTAGLFDNRGELQDIINAFCMRVLLIKSKEIKFVIVVEKNCLFSVRVTEFKTLINSLEKSLPNINKLTSSFSLIVTKLPPKATVEMVIKRLDKIKSELLNDSIIVDTFVKNKSTIGLFYNPLECDNDQTVESLTNIIENTSFSDSKLISNMKPTLSPESLAYLFKEKIALSNMKELDDFLKIFDDIKNNDLKTLFKINDNKNTLKNTKQYLSNYQNIANEVLQSSVPNSLAKFLEKMTMTATKFKNKATEIPQALKLKVEFLKFIDMSTGQKPDYSIFWSKFKLKINEIAKKLSLMRTNVSEKLEEITKEEAQKQIEEINKSHKEQYQSMVKTLQNSQKKLTETQERLAKQMEEQQKKQVIYVPSGPDCIILKQDTEYDNPLLNFLFNNKEIYNKLIASFDTKNETKKYESSILLNLIESFNSFNNDEIEYILDSEDPLEKLNILMGMSNEHETV